MNTENNQDLVIVGIGSSDGGLSALKRVFLKIKPSNMAFVVAHHSSEVIKSFTSLPVDEIFNGSVVTPGRVYVAPAHSMVSIRNDMFEISEATDGTQKLSTIDWLFRSLAEEYKHRAIGILLSGEGIDGVIGLRSISENGGVTITQDEKSSDKSSAALDPLEVNFIDHIVSPDEIASILSKYEKFLNKISRPETLNHLNEEIGAALISICDVLHLHTKHDFKHYKTSTLVRRIRRRMQILQLVDVSAYVEALNLHSSERHSLFNDLLINVTSFFRDPEAFDALKNDVMLEALEQKKPGEKFRIWVAGCSTGEEVYTLAILVHEILTARDLRTEVQIIATDIDEDALNVARKGEYPYSIAEKITPERLEKYFQQKNGRLSVTKQLREMCLFSSHNLILDPPFSQLDLISCRNVLIYLGLHLQKKLIPVFHYALRPQGHLFLGTSEALSTHRDLFQIVSNKFRIAQRKNTAISHPAHSFFNTMNTSYASHFKEAPKAQEEDLHLIGQRILLDEFSPKFAIVGDEFQVLSVSAGITEFFEPNEGSFQNNIVKLVKQNLRAPLRSSLNEARKQKRQINHHFSILKNSQGMQRVGITVQPMPQLGGHTALFMVVFKDMGYISDEVVQSSTSSNSIDVEMVEELERELAGLRDELDKSVQELEASNEELKSSNEELLSMNEELQSANEELEASKEDIQHMNDALQSSNTDLENLLNSTKIATIFLDEKLNIKGFTPSINQIYDLLPHDIGRPIQNFVSKAYSMPRYLFPRDMKNDQVIETEVIMPDGGVFLRRKSAYLNASKKQQGLVVTFINITELRQQEGLFKTLSNAVPQLVWVTDPKGNYVYFSEQWKDFSGMDPDTIKNKGFRDIIHPHDIQGAVVAWEKCQKSGDEFSHEYRLKDKDGTYHWFLVMARAMRDATGNIYRWFGSCTDIQAQKDMQHSLLDIQHKMVRDKKRFDLVADSVDMGVWFCDLPFDKLNWTDTVKKHFWLQPESDVDIDLFYERIHPEDRGPTRHRIETSIKEKSPYDTVYRTVDPKTGATKSIRAIGWTDYDANSNPIRFDGITFDITESLIHTERLQKSELRYELASLATREVIWDWDLVTNQVLWNAALSTELGYDPSEQISNSTWWYEHIHPEDRERVVHGIHEVIDHKGVFWTDSYRFKKSDGTYADIKDQGYVQQGASGPVRMIGAMKDETERKKQLNDIQKAISARDEFLSIASHELKTPVTSMHLQMQMLKRKIDKGEQPDVNYINRVNQLGLRQCVHLTSLIDDMLDVSRIAAGKMTFHFAEVTLNDMVNNAVEAFSINLEDKNVKLESKIESGITIRGDVFRLEQVVYNLLSNALKYGQGRPIKLEVFREGQFGVIKVTDQGLGISKENLARIFDRFERVISSTNITGLGLGLFISQEIVHSHQGTIHVKSQEGKGSEFVVRLPLI